jgi:hypothetical protein
LPGQNRELSAEEVAAKWPDATVAEQEYSTTEVFEYNITHNLTPMADAAGVYEALWRPDERGWTTAKEITPILESGLLKLKADPRRYKKLNPDNGWGSYDVTQAAMRGDHRELLAALRDRIAWTIENPNTHPVALAALSRQLVLISKELSVLDTVDSEDGIASAAATPDEGWSAV